jgi:hypothetical protein
VAARRTLLCGVLLSAALGRGVRADELPADLIAITGHELPRLLGVQVADVAAVAMHAGQPTPVHVQIDQRRRSSEGRWQYVFEAGDDPHPAKPPLVGDDDLILLLVDEGGERLQPAPPWSTEIEVARAGRDSRWFYLARGSPAGLPPLLSYDAARERVRGQDYLLGFRRNGTPVIDTLVLGDPDRDPNILDRSKARLDVDLALGIGHIARTEDDVHVRTTGLHTGPLRIIRECEVRGRLLFGLYSPPVRDNLIFYPHGFVLPTAVRLTRTARLLTRRVTLRISMDLSAAARGLTFESAPDLLPSVAIDGQGGSRNGTQPIAWYLLRSANTGLLGWLEAPDEVARDVTLYYRDERTHADPPDGVPGEIGDHGFLYRHSGPLPAGDVRLSSHAWILHGARLDRPAAELRALDSRPTVRVH